MLARKADGINGGCYLSFRHPELDSDKTHNLKILHLLAFVPEGVVI